MKHMLSLILDAEPLPRRLRHLAKELFSCLLGRSVQKPLVPDRVLLSSPTPKPRRGTAQLAV
jgi:hypothetical protein